MDAKTFLSPLTEKLQDLLAEEATTPNPCKLLEKEVQTAIEDLHSLERSLQDPERQYEVSSLLKAVYSAQDFIDTLLIRKEFQFQPTRRRTINGFKKMLQHPFMCFKPWHSLELKKFRSEIRALFHYHLGREQKDEPVNNIQDVLIGFNNDAASSFLNKEGRQRQHQLYERSFENYFKDEENIVGLEQQINELVALLIPEKKRNPDMSSTHDHSGQVTTAAGDKIQVETPEKESTGSANQVKAINATVVAVVGEAGSGKSTLVRTVYNSVNVRRYFTKRAWVQVSFESKARDVLLSILKQINKSGPAMEMEETFSTEELMACLRKCLRDINYLIVIEDVKTVQVWTDVRDAFNYYSCHGAKIIITSRSENNSWHADSSLSMPPLKDEKGWELLSKKLLLAEDVEVEKKIWELLSKKVQLAEDAEVKKKIVELCGHLPLQILLLGGMLSAKQQNDLSSVNGNANWSTGKDISVLSYEDLPAQIKPCFLYMGLFPKEYEIPVRRLIHLWCAEGFVTPSTSDEMVPEDIAELYFQELVIRNMIQVRWRLDGSPETCRMHDHLHDIFSQGAADKGFYYSNQFQSSHASVRKPTFAVRRLAVAYLGINNFRSSFLDLQHLRSCVVSDSRVRGTPAREICSFLNKITVNKDFVLLTVLDLEGVYKPKLSDAIVKKLLQLKYLGLRSTFIDSLPDSVGNLSNLETLDLKHTNLWNFPSFLRKTKKLQHLYFNCINFTYDQKVMDSLFSESLSNLRTLWGIRMCDNGDGKIRDFLHHLTRLRKLYFTCESTSTIKIITQLTELQSLKVKYIGLGSDLHLQLDSMGKHEKLRDLYLMGKLENSVIKDTFLPCNLRILTLCASELEDDPMPVLGQLKELKILRLFKGSYKGKQMHCCSEGFPKLHVLKLWHLEIPEGWTVQKGAMPCLRKLEIRSCNFGKDSNKTEQLTGLEHLTTLKKFVLINMTIGEKIEESLQKISNLAIESKEISLDVAPK